MSKTLLLIAAIAVMLVGATSAYGYHEAWDGWFSWGILYYEDSAYTCSSPGGTVYDSTAGTVDNFYFSGGIPVAAFVCSAINDTIYLTVSSSTGSKTTGQSGTKEGNGDWSGSAVRRGPSHPPQTFSLVRGTWDTQDTEGQTRYFDYRPATPTYSARWNVSYSIPWGITGRGGSSGYRIRP
ncbi:MAG: hypothetical protein U9Q76_06195 [candidate division WOR-3 bacterium]|nr:hypothetical protein [candidate division WOR-3 bacterium]